MPLNGATYYAHWDPYTFKVTSSSGAVSYYDSVNDFSSGYIVTVQKDYTLDTQWITSDISYLDLGTSTLTLRNLTILDNIVIKGSGGKFVRKYSR